MSDKSPTEKLEWLSMQPSIMEWLDEHEKYAESNALLFEIHDFLEYIRVDDDSPFKGFDSFDDLLAMIEEMKAREQRALSQYLIGFVDKKDVNANSKNTFYNKIKSLFQFNVYSVVFPRNIRISWTPNPFDNRRFRRKPANYEMTVDDFKLVLGCVDEPLWRSVFLAKFQMMQDTTVFYNFNLSGWDKIEDQFIKGESLNGRKDAILIPMPPRSKIKKKGALPYVTSLERDGFSVLRDYFELERGIPENGEPIWVSDRGKPISRRWIGTRWLDYVKKSGLIKPHSYKCPECGQSLKKKRIRLIDGSYPRRYYCSKCRRLYSRSKLEGLSNREMSRIRYGFGLHEACRDVTSSEIEIAIHRTSAPPWVSNLRMGNTSRVDPNGYQKCMQKNYGFAEEIFDLISPWLNVLSEDPYKVPLREHQKLQAEVVELRSAVKEAEWLLSDPETQRILRGLVEERKRNR